MNNSFDDIRHRREQQDEKGKLLEELVQRHDEMVRRVLKQLSEAATGENTYEPEWDELRKEWKVYCGKEQIGRATIPVYLKVRITVTDLGLHRRGRFSATKVSPSLLGPSLTASGFISSTDTEDELVSVINNAMASTVWSRIN